MMNEEKAIDTLFYFKMHFAKSDICREHFDMAIKALEQHPSEDCISREDAVNALRKALYNYEDKTEKQFKESKELNFEDWFQHRIFVQNMNDIDIQTILELPFVKPQPKVGHWNRVIDKAGHWVWECDKCGWQQRFNTNYCPDCGADMAESEG